MTSWQSKALIAKYRITRKKRTFEDAQSLRRSAQSHQSESAQFPDWLRGKFDVTMRDVLGHRCYTLRPRTPASTKHFLYLHGGAYVHQIEGPHWRFLSGLIDRTGAAVSVPLYPLAPAHQYDTTLPMVSEAYESTVGMEAPEDQILMGDSAGGALSLFLAQRLKSQRRDPPHRTVLISPWLDITITAPSMAWLDRQDPYLGAKGLREAGRLYAGDLDPHDPRVSPIYGALEGLGPITVCTGTRDILLADSRRFRKLAAERGVAIDYEEYEGMFHGWMLQNIPEASHAAASIARQTCGNAHAQADSPPVEGFNRLRPWLPRWP